MLICYQYAYTMSMTVTSRRLGYQLKRTQHALRLRMDEALHALGLTAPQYAVLSILEEAPRLSNADLARRSFVTPQTMIRIVVGLEERGLLSRAARTDNARILEASLSDVGRQLLAKAHAAVGRIERRMVQGITRDERTMIGRVLEAMADNLDPA